MKRICLAFATIFAFAQIASAQTDIQTFYDFGKDRHHLTTTVEGFYADKWGSTFFFIDHDYNSKNNDNHVYAPSGTYWEISRALNFWQNTAFAPVSAHVEYNGGVYHGYTVNNSWLFGADYGIHNEDFTKTFTVGAYLKFIDYNGAIDLFGEKRKSAVPLQFSIVWGLKNIFGVTGLNFNGFADFWWQSHAVYQYVDGAYDYTTGEEANVVFISEPQIWYNVGQHFGCDNLNVGSEVEITYNFGTGKGFWVRPCLGFKWVF